MAAKVAAFEAACQEFAGAYSSDTILQRQQQFRAQLHQQQKENAEQQAKIEELQARVASAEAKKASLQADICNLTLERTSMPLPCLPTLHIFSATFAWHGNPTAFTTQKQV